MFRNIKSPLPGLLRQSVRYKRKRTARKDDARIEVQLLKDFPTIGERGEIIKVLPAVMRNLLHMNSGACYILPGQEPRIPVIDRTEFRAQQKQIELERLAAAAAKKLLLEENKHTKDAVGALSLDQLSQLFQDAKTRGRFQSVSSNEQITAEEDGSTTNVYTQEDLTESLPENINIALEDDVQGKLTLDYVVGYFRDVSGINFTSQEVTLVDKEGKRLTVVSDAGTYLAQVRVHGQSQPFKVSISLE